MIAIISTALFLTLWFLMVHRELKTKTDTVNSAKSQLTACRKNHMLARDSSEAQDAKSILTRSLDIYNQSVINYNQTLLKPSNRIPSLLMGFRQIKDEESTMPCHGTAETIMNSRTKIQINKNSKKGIKET